MIKTTANVMERLQDSWLMKLSTLFVCFMTATANEVVSKSFNENLTLPCGCHDNQNCYSVINNNLTNTGSYITQNGNLFLPPGTWDVHGKVCCGTEEQLQCYTVCSYTERCEACSLTISANVSSVNGTIRATQGDKMTFNITFTHQNHNAFTFKVNKSILPILEPNFPCTEVRDTNVMITQTLSVQYHCVAMEPGNYSINAYVTFCNFDYNDTEFIVIVANATTMVSSTAESDQSTSSINQPVSSTTSTTQPISPTASSHVILPGSTSMISMMSSTIMPANNSVLPTSTNDNQDTATDDDTITIVIAVICIFIFIAVVVIIGILLYKMYLKRRNARLHNWLQQQSPKPVAGDSPMNQTQAQYEINRPISNISNDSDIVPVGFDTPLESSATVSFAHYPEQVVMSATTQVPDEDRTPHQLWIATDL